MPARLFLLLSVALLTASCGGGEKHLPSSNPPEYDPKKVYAAPSAPPDPSPQSSIQPVKPKPPRAAADIPCERLPIDPADPEKPPTLCGGGSGGGGGSSSGGVGSGGGGSERPTDPSAQHPPYVLEFRSMIVSTSKVDPAQSQASAFIPLVASGEVSPNGETKYIGQGMIAYQTGPLPNWNACDPLVKGQGSVPMRVFQAFILVNPPQGGANVFQGGSAKIELLYGILGMSLETSTSMHYILNYRCVPNPPEPESFWSTKYVSGRGEVSTIPEQMFLLKDWTYVGRDGVVATKTLNSTCGGMCDLELATFTLREGESSPARR